jgi:hypothetical protein
VRAQLNMEILPQPDDFSCGATCLHAVYRYYGDEMPLGRIVEEVEHLEEGGTLAAFLGSHALIRGYQARIYTYNLKVFDPTWFGDPGLDLKEKLALQARYKRHSRLRAASLGYQRFLDLGGEICYEDLTAALLRKHLLRRQPLLTGLSATYLYREKRERGADNEPDDLRGEPVGHFVVVHGYNRETRSVMIADPLEPEEGGMGRYYQVSIERLLGAVLLGVITYDANLLAIWPRKEKEKIGGE